MTRYSNKINVLAITLILLLASLNLAKAQTEDGNLKTFFDSWVPEIKLKVNATAETKPTQNITVMLSLEGKSEILVKHLNFSIYGFNRDHNKILLNSITDENLLLNTKRYQRTFKVPENVCGITYGEITLVYDVEYAVGQGRLTMPYNVTVGFTMTKIEDVYLKSLEAHLNDLNETFMKCFGKNLTTDELLSLNQTWWQLNNEYESLKGVKGELDNTRSTMVILAIIAIIFFVTTAYLVFRRPKTYW
ncbi:MAG: hypothetical protein QXN96_01770 [Candidatus Bathyarchaeia archaeon]